jgi:hypothetical protein
LTSLQRLGVKLFCREGAALPLVEFIPVFHKWIQTGVLADLLIDVADYSHVKEGPGVILVSDGGIYSIDETNGRRGLMYVRRRAMAGTATDSLAEATKAALRAARRLEQDFDGRMEFRGDQLLVFANDRLLAPNSEQTMKQFRPHLEQLLAKLFPSSDCKTTQASDPRERFSVSVVCDANVSLSELASRMGC